jgi:hypothetical protein
MGRAYVGAMTANRPEGPCLEGTLDRQYATIDAMHARQTIEEQDARALKSNASRPFIAALVAQIQSGQVARHDVQRIITQINDMHRAGEISTRQAKHVRALADPILNPPQPTRTQPSPGMDDATRVELLETLAHLRNTGALTENEYQAEKQRLRAGPIRTGVYSPTEDGDRRAGPRGPGG